ncbi:cation transporting ATPase C-terminal domain-containing protein, partial [Longispora sp. NPDC051575]|uniref:cation transporting ATPase C-terminal domain-containing protein n=1 Tax=Longispora sp. NPDC051575 TaxID=3154943 RepID=UPI00343E71E1
MQELAERLRVLAALAALQGGATRLGGWVGHGPTSTTPPTPVYPPRPFLGVALAVRARRQPGQPRNWWLPAAVAVSLAGQLAALWLAPVRALLGTESLTGYQVSCCALAASVPGVALAGY